MKPKTRQEITLELYRTACNDVLRQFCEKNEYDYDPESWIGGDVGGTAYVCGDMAAIRMDEMVADLELNAQKDEFLRYNEYDKECRDLGLQTINYRAWLRGAPRHSRKAINRARKYRDNIEALKEKFLKTIDEINETTYPTNPF